MAMAQIYPEFAKQKGREVLKTAGRYFCPLSLKEIDPTVIINAGLSKGWLVLRDQGGSRFLEPARPEAYPHATAAPNHICRLDIPACFEVHP